ncbi:MAG: hypothetical protein IBJ00_05045, partial [Alphaproteobacteria bacterium]|nr:hypothetical protein [Alphaproteobacteria bacterium]
LYGRKGGYVGSINLALLNPSQGLIIRGTEENDHTGGSVSYAGDINVDGISDVIVGAYGSHHNTGASYVIYGNKSFSIEAAPTFVKPLSFESNYQLKQKKDTQKNIGHIQKIPFIQEKLSSFSSLQSVYPSTSDSISLKPQVSWYSPTRWHEAVKSLWSSYHAQSPLSSEAASLVSLKNKCNELIEDTTDKGYAFNLKDLVRDMEEALDHPQAITAKTVKRFKGYLGDLNREYAKEQGAALSPYMQALLLGTAPGQASLSFTPSTELNVIGSLPQAPMLGFNPVLPALAH